MKPSSLARIITTGGFWVEPYDKQVCAVLLLAIYHFGDKIEIHSDGLATLYVNTETKKAAPEWESAITYVEERFGYFFDHSVYRDEYGQVHIKLEPIQNRKGI